MKIRKKIYLGVTEGKWRCDGRIEEEKCLSNIKTSEQSKNIPRFRCEKCDFDFCLKCFEHHKIDYKNYVINNKYNFRAHEHPLVFLGNTDTDWFCNANKFRDGCINGFNKVEKHINTPRFRCKNCDFDLCLHCFQYYDVLQKRCSIF